MEQYFFEIPVYNDKRDDFYSKRSAYITKELQRYGIEFKLAPHTFYMSENHHQQRYGSWNYNDVIGWIGLYILGAQIRGEYWTLDYKRIPSPQNRAKRNFIRQGKAFELDTFKEQSAKEIFEEICHHLEQLQKEKPFRNRHIDLRAFHAIGPYVDWRKLVNTNPW